MTKIIRFVTFFLMTTFLAMAGGSTVLAPVVSVDMPLPYFGGAISYDGASAAYTGAGLAGSNFGATLIVGTPLVDNLDLEARASLYPGKSNLDFDAYLKPWSYLGDGKLYGLAGVSYRIDYGPGVNSLAVGGGGGYSLDGYFADAIIKKPITGAGPVRYTVTFGKTFNF